MGNSPPAYNKARLWLSSTVVTDKDKFQINLDVQQFKPEELKVTISYDNSIITVEARQKDKTNEHRFIPWNFFKSYVLPKGHDIGKVVSRLSSDGVLSVTVPINQEEFENRTIPIQQTGVPYKLFEGKEDEAKK